MSVLNHMHKLRKIGLVYKTQHIHTIGGDNSYQMPIRLNEADEESNLRNSILRNNDWKIITLVREPIARLMSAYYSFHKGVGDIYSFDHTAYEKWFDRQLNKYLGFDIWAHEFNKERGWSIYKNVGKCKKVLVLRTENISSSFNEAISEFLDEEVVLENEKANIGSYNFVNLSESFVNQIYDTKVARHFYTNSEIDTFKSIWLRSF